MDRMEEAMCCRLLEKTSLGGPRNSIGLSRAEESSKGHEVTCRLQ